MSIVVDVHAHIIVPEITRQAEPGEDWRPHVFYEGTQQVVEAFGRQIRSAIFDFVHLDRILAAQEQAGVERVLLCPWVSLLRYDTDPQDGLRTSRIQNQALARMAQAHPKRVAGLGTVPLQDPELAAQELRDLMQEPGLFGVEIAASVNGVYLGDDRFQPFWEAAEETAALVFIHPTTRGFNAAVFNEYYLWNSVGNPLETTITAAHMVMAGVMEDHPGLKVLLAHGGGTILALRGRLEHAYSFQPQARARLRESPVESLKRFYYDSLTHNLSLLKELVDFVGAQRVLVGSDYPFDMGAQHPAKIVKSLGLPPDDESQILSGNALKLMRKEH